MSHGNKLTKSEADLVAAACNIPNRVVSDTKDEELLGSFAQRQYRNRIVLCV
jgi:hypothetical protein